jgi:hypothetical protein
MRIICLKSQNRCVKERAKESAEINSANKAAFQKSRIAVRERISNGDKLENGV